MGRISHMHVLNRWYSISDVVCLQQKESENNKDDYQGFEEREHVEPKRYSWKTTSSTRIEVH